GEPVPVAPVLQPIAAAGQEGDTCGGVGDPEAAGSEKAVEGEQPVKERVECGGGARRAVAVGVDVIATGDARHRCPDLIRRKPTAERQEVERLDLGGGPEVEAVRYVYLQDGLHHDHPAKCSASPAGTAPTSRKTRSTAGRRGGWCARPTEPGNVFVIFFQTPIYE
ncbi:hypothetical protein G3M55_25065, partial [Streptomyces sp. SID8455]|nr:hypothetical protein [Streptomyces sp. SID8455]